MQLKVNTVRLQSSSIYIDADTYKLHMKRFVANESAPPILMIHGSIENGKIFYSDSGKGLAPYLAMHGFDVFVADLRGRGQSTPAVSAESEFGIMEILRDDFPLYVRKIRDYKGNMPQHWIAHSWGGVLMLSYIAKYRPPEIASMVFMGVKRRITVKGLKKWFMINVMWQAVARRSIKKHGYLPAVSLRMGSDNESARTHGETDAWVRSVDWIDWYDGFNYAQALQDIQLPPLLSITGSNDDVLGAPKDAQALLTEAGAKDAIFKVIGTQQGFAHAYDHINLLTHKDAPSDHFVLILEWLRKHKK